jgi:pyruvate carboxylase
VNLFVYGTLRRGIDNEFAAMLARSARFVSSGKVQGEIYLVAHYPGLILGGRDWIVGDVFELDGETLRALDEYEGSEQFFRRVEAPVLLDSGEWIQAYVYIYTGDTSGRERILSGDWLNANRPPQ